MYSANAPSSSRRMPCSSGRSSCSSGVRRGLASSRVSAGHRCHHQSFLSSSRRRHYRASRDRDSLASLVLALALATSFPTASRPPADRCGHTRSNPSDVEGKPALARGHDCRRARQARPPSVRTDRGPIPAGQPAPCQRTKVVCFHPQPSRPDLGLAIGSSSPCGSRSSTPSSALTWDAGRSCISE